MYRTRVATTSPHQVISAVAVAVAGFLFGCSDDVTPPDKSGTFYGPVTTMAGGSGRTYVTLDGAGTPTAVGIAITENSLTELPAATAEYVFAMPSQASATAYKHAVINWMPTGHAPAGVYTVPHFDVHFYMITNAERAGIVLGDATLTARMNRQPAAEFVPVGYAVGMASEGMGLHWNDPAAPERSGAPFTKTFIYGSYDGVMTFAEPMLAKSYLETKPATTVTAVKLPAQYATHGYQAASYSIGFDQGTKEFRFALTDLVLR